MRFDLCDVLCSKQHFSLPIQCTAFAQIVNEICLGFEGVASEAVHNLFNGSLNM